MGFRTNILLFALSAIGVGSLAYLLFTKDENEERQERRKRPGGITHSIKVPKDSVGIIIGRQGKNIREIELLTGVKIKFANENDEESTCFISGTLEAVHDAENIIHEKISTQPLIETTEIKVPGEAIARIIGKNGITIRQISLNSNAKISVGREPLSGNQRSVILKGTVEQIAVARYLINDKVVEEREYQSRLEQSLGQRSPRHQPKYLLANSAADTNIDPHSMRERLVPISNDGLLEVYVSAMESPDRFWLQMKGPRTVELDRLNDVMTEHYSKPEMKEIHRLDEVRIGQLVAAPFTYDQKYYRAEVTEISSDCDSDPDLTLYYLDYGDSAACRLSATFALKTEFLTLRFQAVECILARIKPSDDKWTEAATDILEELTYVALWKPLIAKIRSFRTRPTRGNREGSPVPCVDLYDTTEGKEVDIAKELVSSGHAVWDEEENLESSSNDNPATEVSQQIGDSQSNIDHGSKDQST